MARKGTIRRVVFGLTLLSCVGGVVVNDRLNDEEAAEWQRLSRFAAHARTSKASFAPLECFRGGPSSRFDILFTATRKEGLDWPTRDLELFGLDDYFGETKGVSFSRYLATVEVREASPTEFELGVVVFEVESNSIACEGSLRGQRFLPTGDVLASDVDLLLFKALVPDDHS